MKVIAFLLLVLGLVKLYSSITTKMEDVHFSDDISFLSKETIYKITIGLMVLEGLVSLICSLFILLI